MAFFLGGGGGCYGENGESNKSRKAFFYHEMLFNIHRGFAFLLRTCFGGYTLGDGYHSVQFWSNTTSERKTYEAAAQRGSALSLLIRTFGFHALEHRMSRCWLAEERETG